MIHQVESLVDILASVRIELTAGHSIGPFAVPDRDRVHRASVQVEMALAKAKDLATALHLRYQDLLKPPIDSDGQAV